MGFNERRGGQINNSTFEIDYKDTKALKRFLSESGKILPRRRTGLRQRLHALPILNVIALEAL